MSADRKLDEAIAREIMGHKTLWAHAVWSEEDWLCTDTPTEQNVMAIVTEKDDGVFSMPKYLVIPYYSSDLGVAGR